MINLKHRSSQKEIMDDFSQSGETMSQTLRELARINTLLGGNYVSTDGIDQLLLGRKEKKYHITDLGCGGGDMMVYLSNWGKRNDLKLEFSGIDANAAIIDFAKQNTSLYENIEYHNLNIFSIEFKAMTIDVVHCSLFTHHFEDDELVTLLRQLLAQARIGLVINDLHRHHISYYFTKWIIRSLSKSSMVRYDSVVSIMRSFKRNELMSILKRAGITNYSLKWKWAFRWQLVIYK
ncbi:MAG: methyltransferase domain-containing protein [Cyclobacteriaceae bacterium]|jgi:2-polyprenyl-3-methyl-5-hydroxy-6-metoxy-1,4-benzoquinol methylase|nr:methyltransferase domain-containing protein [Cyclobacteriaceae bacterium]